MPAVNRDGVRDGFAVTGSGERKIPSLSNAIRAVERVADDLGICFNDDTSEWGFRREVPWRARGAGVSFLPVRETDYTELAAYLEDEFDVEFKFDHVKRAFKAVGRREGRLFNPAREWLEGLPEWDGVDRFADFWERMGADVGEGIARDYYALVARMLFLSIVTRRFDPGAKYDLIVVMESAQGILKNEFLIALAGEDYYCGVKASLLGSFFTEREMVMRLIRAGLIHIEEFDVLDRGKSDALKQLASERFDWLRRMWTDNMEQVPRRSIIVATTNRRHYLSDPTGNRRFLPLPLWGCDYLNLDYLRATRDALFSQAVAEMRAGVVPAVDSRVPGAPAGAAMSAYVARMQSWRVVGRAWSEILEEYLGRVYPAGGWVSNRELFMKALGMSAVDCENPAHGRQMSAAMRGLCEGADSLWKAREKRVRVCEGEGAPTVRMKGWEVRPTRAEREGEADVVRLSTGAAPVVGRRLEVSASRVDAESARGLDRGERRDAPETMEEAERRARARRVSGGAG